MITYLWFNKTLLWRLLIPISWIYSLINDFIRLCYKLGWKKSWRAPIPVVVVGNITVGGNGKTPFVIWLVEKIKKYGIRVGVVSRGYGGKAKHYPLILDRQTKTEEAGDEAILIYKRTGVPVAVDPNRSNAVQALLDKNSLQIIITDDGLQHYALARDVEIVIIDGLRRFGNGYQIPAGPMRERVSRLRSVNAIIVNGGVAKNGEIIMRIRPKLAVNLLTGEKCKVSQLNNLVAMAGIGHPAHFFSTLEKCGAKIIKRISLADHKILKAEKINSFTHQSQMLIMTEKDAVKYFSFARENWWYLPINAELSSDQTKYLLQHLISLAKKDFYATSDFKSRRTCKLLHNFI